MTSKCSGTPSTVAALRTCRSTGPVPSVRTLPWRAEAAGAGGRCCAGHDRAAAGRTDNYLDVPGNAGWSRNSRDNRRPCLLVSPTVSCCQRGDRRGSTPGGYTCGYTVVSFGTWPAAGEPAGSGAESTAGGPRSTRRSTEMVRLMQRSAAVNDGMASRYAARRPGAEVRGAGPPPNLPRETSHATSCAAGGPRARDHVCRPSELTG